MTFAIPNHERLCGPIGNAEARLRGHCFSVAAVCDRRTLILN
jgi:hypothetical protein